VYALNAVTGARVWTSAPFGQGPLYEAVVAGPSVITPGSDAAGPEVSVLNLSNGKVVWHNDGCSDEGVNPPAGLVVGLQVMSYGCDSEGNPTIQASNLATGAVVWSLPGRWTLQRGDLSGSAGRHLYATNPAGTVVSLNPQTGHAQYSLAQAVRVLAVDSSRVYATCGSHGKYLCGYDIGTGALQWRNTQLGGPARLAAEADGVLYLDFGDAINAATGQKITTTWNYNFRPVTAIAVGDGRIAVVSKIDPRVLDLFGLPGY
jgi:outer membrane protein assembly factor BamB